MKKNNNGFTLIEIVIVIVIMSVLSFALLNLFSSALNESDYMTMKKTADELALSKIEWLKSLNYDSMIFYNNDIENYNSILNFKDFKRETFIQPYNAGDTECYKIQVNVKWISNTKELIESFSTLESKF